MENIELSIKDYKKIKKIIKNDNCNKNYILKLDKKVYKYNEKEFWMNHIINALNIKNIEKRYVYIYDTMCDILDDISHKICDFNCNKCYSNRCNKSVFSTNGCCYFNKKQCPYLINGKCQVKSLSCKIFICYALEKKYKFRSNVETYPLLNLFFNKKQKELIHYSYRVPKEELIPKLIKYIKEK